MSVYFSLFRAVISVKKKKKIRKKNLDKQKSGNGF